MSVSFRSVSGRLLCLAGLCAALAACNDKDKQADLNALDARLTNGAGAGGLAPQSDAEREAQQAAGGRIDPAPAAIASADVGGSATLGELARRKAVRGGTAGPAAAAAGGSCASSVDYGNEWAARMPAPFRLYPRARLAEAAGNQTDRCKLRVISFSTDVPLDRVLAYYFTQARRAGYDSEHLLVREEHQLGGTKGDLAYVVFARPGAGGRTDVDVVANVE